MDNAVLAFTAAADAALARNDHASAEQSFRALLAASPTDLRALAFLLNRAEERKDATEALQLATQLMALLPGNAMVLSAASRAHDELGNLDLARLMAQRAISADPSCLDALLVMGTIDRKRGDSKAALRSELKALELARSQQGVKITSRTANQLSDAAARVNAAMFDEISTALNQASASNPGEDISRIWSAGEIFCGQRERGAECPEWNPALLYVPGLEPRRWYEREEFDWISRVEEATHYVREELLGVMQGMSGFSPYVNERVGSRGAEYWATLNRSSEWSAFHFSRHGKNIDENRRRCPRTAALLDSLPLMRIPGYAPEPMFSVLRPRTRIPPHYGSVNGRLTVHLPLIVPADCGALKVGEEARTWKEGQVLIFDDAMLHEAWNDSNDTRVVLIFDIWNPQLSAAEQQAFTTLLTVAQRFERSLIGN